MINSPLFFIYNSKKWLDSNKKLFSVKVKCITALSDILFFPLDKRKSIVYTTNMMRSLQRTILTKNS